MTRGEGPEATEFREIMTSLALDAEGWRGEAGVDFVELMQRVFARLIAARERGSRSESLLTDPADAVAEAVLVVDGPERVSLAQNVQRILGMDKPLGYVVGSVAANLSRADMAGQMGSGSRQVGRGATRVLHFDELAIAGECEPLDRLNAEPAWARGPGRASQEARLVAGTFVALLAQRFRVRAEATWLGLEVAGTSALTGDAGVGMTPATARRRVGLFMKELPALKGIFDRTQAQAFAWLVFGTERHPEWSLLSECARSLREKEEVRVSPWHARHARTVATRPGQIRRDIGRQPALFSAPITQARHSRMTA